MQLILSHHLSCVRHPWTFICSEFTPLYNFIHTRDEKQITSIRLYILSESVQHDMWSGWGYVILVTLFSILFNLNTFFELTYDTAEICYDLDEGSECEGWEDLEFSFCTLLGRVPITGPWSEWSLFKAETFIHWESRIIFGGWTITL